MGTLVRRRHIFSLTPLLLLAAAAQAAAPRLSPNYYRHSCPRAERIVSDVIAAKQRANPSTAAGTLRLFFHDCFVNGCDASVLVSPLSSSSSGPAPERAAEINLSLPGDAFDAVDRAKAALEAACPGVVSCADVLALAARDLVAILGGPRFPVALGRRDSARSDARDVEGNLPRTNMSARAMAKLFASKGVTPREMVALAGAHTVGFSHCAEFAGRLYGFRGGDGYDPRLNPEFARALRGSCAGYKSDPTVSIFNDVVTPRDFDESYYKNLPSGLGLLASDAALWEYPPTRVFVRRYADNRTAFFEDFAAAMQRLGAVGVKTGRQGVVRRRCDALD
jgi:peroxidase